MCDDDQVEITNLELDDINSDIGKLRNNHDMLEKRVVPLETQLRLATKLNDQSAGIAAKQSEFLTKYANETTVKASEAISRVETMENKRAEQDKDFAEIITRLKDRLSALESQHYGEN
jgi:ubiquinone biosynthesis protein UbiJ